MTMNETWKESWDLASIPEDVFFSEVQTRRALKVQNPGRKRSCGHANRWVMSCPTCVANYKRTERRIANEMRAAHS